jgi:thiol:disulfide interchange protein DsbC
MKKIIEERKDIVFYIKMYPLVKIHPAAYEKSKAIVCEKSLELLESAHSNKPLPKPNCETNAVDENIKLAEKLGITGLPALVFPDGRLMSGYRDAKGILTFLGN